MVLCPKGLYTAAERLVASFPSSRPIAEVPREAVGVQMAALPSIAWGSAAASGPSVHTGARIAAR